MTCSLTSSDWIALASATVAICALAISIWQGWLQRRHNILSVTPYLDVNVDGTRPSEVVISVKNSGLGPAYLDSVVANVRNEQMPLNTRESYLRFVSAMSPSGQAKIHYSVADTTSVIAAGAEIVLLRIALANGAAPSNIEIKKFLEDTEFTVAFRSFYGRKYKTGGIKSAS
jgi:hypothetical protein